MNHLFDGLLHNTHPERRFARIPGAPERHYSYRAVRDVSGRFADALRRLGVAPGDRVVAQVPKSLEALMLYLGVVRAGGVFVPLNPAYTAREVSGFLADAEPRLFVCDPASEGELETVAARAGASLRTMGVWRDPQTFAGTLFADVNDVEGEGLDVPSIGRDADDLAAILYTSGTTGRSKGAMLSHDNLLSNARTLAALWRFEADDVLIHALPIFHTHGLFVATNTVLASGGSLIFLPRFDAEAVMDAMADATALMGVPTFYTRLLEHSRLSREAAANMRVFISGSAPLLAETHARWAERTGHAILERYGMTETNMNTSNPYDGERRAGTVGLPLPDVALRIADPETGARLEKGAIGSIEVQGPNVFSGYWRMPEKTAEEFRDDGFFITGDLGILDDDGYVSIVGRSKDLIISGGYNVYPKEVEALIDAVDGVKESAVIGLPHGDLGEGVAAIVAREADGSVTADGILDAIAPDLARYKQPRHVVLVVELPRNAMGKVQKAALRERYKEAFAAKA